MSLGIANNNINYNINNHSNNYNNYNRRSPLEINRSFIFPPSNNKIWTTEPNQLLELQQQLSNKQVFGNITNTNNTNNIRQNIEKIETFPTSEIVMSIHFPMTPGFKSLFVGNDNFWMNKIASILQNLGLNFLYYDSSIHSLRYTFIPHINIRNKQEYQRCMALCYSNLKSLIDEHIYNIIENKINTGMLVLDHELDYAEQYLKNDIARRKRNFIKY